MLPPNSELNRTGVAFALTDLDVGLTFMDVADVSSILETIQRNHINARTAYDSVVRLLLKLTPDVLQQQLIDEKLATLKKRLLATGQKF